MGFIVFVLNPVTPETESRPGPSCSKLKMSLLVNVSLKS